MIAAILDCPFHLSIMTEEQTPVRSTAALEQETIARTEAVEKAVKDGLSFGAPTEREVEIAQLMVELVPGIETAASKWGEGAAVVCRPKSAVIQQIRCGIKKALGKDFSACRINMPERFVYEVTFKDWKRAYQMSFYPGMKPVDTFTDRLETENWMDVVTAHSFVVY